MPCIATIHGRRKQYVQKIKERKSMNCKVFQVLVESTLGFKRGNAGNSYTINSDAVKDVIRQ